ncbi:GNAT family N-acetyltransferase [Sodalinema gerasimenkoae]|uniref:GNAT family N-acetyltransferase n=1 Tax=Sodalinema gerasimenkoae TaxID=2862348 RepID=UPI001359D4F2|nr:GNAT family N-acetyltransferase [Sodalinema gerasimenkoae]MCC5900040.1 GNAT family N-acetyltransferase [Phormidium sp. BM_Day4_Bin.17]UCJ10825.1 MAG: GNAT family N-acetyltransferase [Phormidium sp. PBR-2020]
MTSLVLHPLTSHQLEPILQLDQLCFGGLWTQEGYQRELDSPNSILLGIQDQDLPEPLLALGCLWAILDEAHLTILAVHPDYRRRGLGQLMLWGLLHAARQRQLSRATLEVNANNLAARSLYEQFGFREAGRRRRYYGNGDDALILWLSGLQNGNFLQKLEEWDQQIQHRIATWGGKILKRC